MSEFGQSNVHSTRRDPSVGRLKVDVSNTAFWEGKEFYTSFEVLGLGVGQSLVLKYQFAKDLIIQEEYITCDAGGLRLRAFKDDKGVEGGVFSTMIEVFKNAEGAEFPDVATTMTCTTGGTFTPNVGAYPRAQARVSAGSSGSSGKGVAVGESVGSERAVSAGTAYVVIDSIAQSGDSSGVLFIKWEERN